MEFISSSVIHPSSHVPFFIYFAELTSDERKLLNLAVKGAMGSRRTAWRAICADLQTNPEKKSIIEDYKSMIETELIDISTSVQGLSKFPFDF